MSDEHPTNEFPAYGASAPQPGPPGAAGPQPPAATPSPPTGPRRNRRLTLILVAAIVVVLGAGIGVAVAVGTDNSGTPQGSPSSTTAGSQASGAQQGKNGKKKGKRNVVRGTITAQSGSTWTVKTLQGQTVKVTIGSDTKFGTKQAAATKADFTVGKQVVVAGAPGASTGSGAVTARRVRALAANAGKKKGTKKSGATSAPSSSPS